MTARLVSDTRGPLYRKGDLRHALDLPADMQPIGVVTIGHPLPDRRSGSLKRGWVSRDDFAEWL